MPSAIRCWTHHCGAACLPHSYGAVQVIHRSVHHSHGDPAGISRVVLILLLTGSTLNIMSLMGVIMMTGIVVSNSILIVEFTGTLRNRATSDRATVEACRVRLRPILMTSLATLLGMVPMALGLEAGSEQYAPLARAVIGGLAVSVVVTVFLVPAVYLVIHGRHQADGTASEGLENA